MSRQKKKRGPWWVVAKEEIGSKKFFCIYDPVPDDTIHTETCYKLQNQGRHVNITTSDINTSREDIQKYFEKLGYEFTERDILFG